MLGGLRPRGHMLLREHFEKMVLFCVFYSDFVFKNSKNLYFYIHNKDYSYTLGVGYLTPGYILKSMLKQSFSVYFDKILNKSRYCYIYRSKEIIAAYMLMRVWGRNLSRKFLNNDAIWCIVVGHVQFQLKIICK